MAATTDHAGAVTDQMWDWPRGRKRFSWEPSDLSFEPGFTADSSVVFDHPTVGGFRNVKTGEELRAPWKAAVASWSA